jgi:hypothetical protein
VSDPLKRLFTAILVGGLLGVVGARYLFVGSWLSLIPWSIAGLAVGYWSGSAKWALAGGLYGFALLSVFMIVGYTGSASTLSRLPFFAIIGLAGALYGALLALVGVLIRRRLSSPRGGDAA